MNYTEAQNYIESIQVLGIVPGLESITSLCERIGNPQKKLSFVHIAGTNGKGSTLAYVSTICKCAGLKVGRYISPTIFEYRERIQVNGRNITKNAFCEGVEILRDACLDMVSEGMPHPTPFEVETALAFWYFEKTGCDIVVLETGMGGLSDATNLIENTVVALLASISMDHMKFLGNTLEKIATQKAGIIKNGCEVVSAMQAPEVMSVIERTAGEKGCSLTIAESRLITNIRRGRGRNMEVQKFDYHGADGLVLKNLEIHMAGVVQTENALLAIEGIRALMRRGFAIPEAAIRKGLLESKWVGRLTVVDKKKLFVVDGAHNEDAAKRLSESIEFYFTNKRIIYIMGMLRDKEYEKVIELTHGYADQIITVTPPDNSRALSALELAGELQKVHAGVTAAGSLEEAVEMARLLAGDEDVILAFGSLSYLGRLIRIVEGNKNGRSGESKRSR